MILIALMALPSSGRSLVLCLGADGHMAFESAVAGRCCQEPSGQSESALLLAQASGTQSDCGLCADLIIGGDASTQLRLDTRARAVKVIPSVALFDSVASLAPVVLSTPFFRPPQRITGANTSLSHLRTVTILV
jgi:hypothetical protein